MTDRSQEKVHVAKREGVAVLTLSDPDRRNAIDAGMTDEIIAAVRFCEDDPAVRALVITGEGKAFCAGAVLGAIEGVGREDYRRIYESFMCVARSRLPTVAAVNGAAVGAGMNLALACDLRLVAKSASFICRFAEIGLHPGGGHIWMLSRAVGDQVARAMVLFGEELSGPESVIRGLAYHCVDDEALLDQAVELAAGAALASRELNALVKETFGAVDGNHEDALEAELEAQHWSSRQPFHLERIRALKKRLIAD